MNSRTNIITVTLEVEVDEHVWASTYGRGDAYDRAEAQRSRSLVADVEDYVLGQVAESAAAEEGAITGVDLVNVAARRWTYEHRNTGQRITILRETAKFVFYRSGDRERRLSRKTFDAMFRQVIA